MDVPFSLKPLGGPQFSNDQDSPYARQIYSSRSDSDTLVSLPGSILRLDSYDNPAAAAVRWPLP